MDIQDGNKGLIDPSQNQKAEVNRVVEAVEKGSIRGIDIALIERIIDLMGKYYPQARRASVYLEQRQRVFNVVGITNLRDVASHIATICRQDIGDRERQESLNQLEEHLRRAIVESYEIVVDEYSEQFLAEYSDYEKNILPRERLAGIHKITNHQAIRDKLKVIGKLYEEGRNKKDGNIWNRDWEEGVEKLVSAAEDLENLTDELKHYKELYYQSMSSKYLWLWGALIAVIAIIVTIAVGYIFSK